MDEHGEVAVIGVTRGFWPEASDFVGAERDDRD